MSDAVPSQSGKMSQFELNFHADTISNRTRLQDAFSRLTPHERRLLTCALAGNHPEQYAPLRPSVIRALAWADMHPEEDQFR